MTAGERNGGVEREAEALRRYQGRPTFILIDSLVRHVIETVPFRPRPEKGNPRLTS